MSLRAQVVRGGAFLALRQGLGLVIGLVGVLLLTRRIGPENYGLYAAAVGVTMYIQNLALCGIGVYLVRRPGEDERAIYDLGSTLLVVLGVLAAVAAIAGLPMLVRLLELPRFEVLAQAMLVLLPLALVGQVAMAKLERALDFGRVAVLELTGQIIFFAVALPLAYSGFGMWAPAIGWIVQQSGVSIGAFAAARYRPRLRWSSTDAREMLGYGISFSSSIWVWNLRALVNPIVVGRFAGAEAVGIVALTIRLVEQLSFVKTATWRLSIAALGRVQGDAQRLRRAVSEGIGLQVIALGPILLAFGWLSPWLVPEIFGAEWAPAVRIYPFVAAGYLANAVFALHSSAMYVLRRNWEVTAFHLAHVVLLAGVAISLVPRWGIVGYGIAEIAALPSYLLVHRYFVSAIGSPRYVPAAVWAFAIGIALFSYYAWWTALALIPIAMLPSSRGEVAALWRGVWQGEAAGRADNQVGT